MPREHRCEAHSEGAAHGAPAGITQLPATHLPGAAQLSPWLQRVPVQAVRVMRQLKPPGRATESVDARLAAGPCEHPSARSTRLAASLAMPAKVGTRRARGKQGVSLRTAR